MARGPPELLPRLIWLSTPGAQAWTPSGPECTEQYLDVMRERQNPKPAAAAATPLSATTRGRS